MNYKKQILASLVIAVTVSACSTYDIGTGSDNCAQIGCADGLQFYPHEEYSAVYQHRRFYGVNGVLPEDLPAGSPERAALRQQQIAKLRSMGLDAYGRPLNQ
jgi:hypothetical protein